MQRNFYLYFFQQQQLLYAALSSPGSPDPSQIITKCLHSLVCLLQMYLINPFPSDDGLGGQAVKGALFCVQLKMPFSPMSSSINGTRRQSWRNVETTENKMHKFL